MSVRARNQGGTLRVGLVLFDEAHTRVFVLRGTQIEDAREYTVDVNTLKSSHGSVQMHRRLPTSTRVRERAARTARLVVELHDSSPLDYLLMAGPPWAQALLWQHLPSSLRLRLMGSLNLPVSAGENAILTASIPSVQMIARRAHSVQRRATVAASQRSRPGSGKQVMTALGSPSWHTVPQTPPVL